MTRKNKRLPTPEWCVEIEAENISDKPLRMKIAADDDARAALARRLHISELISLTAAVTFIRAPGNPAVHATGEFKAHIRQSCVVSGDPVTSDITESFEAWFADKSKMASIAKARREQALRAGGAEMPIMEEQDDPEPIIDGMIDAGEMVVQFLSLAINPFPRAPGAALDNTVDAPPPPPVNNPFAGLKNWKDSVKPGKGRK